MDNDKQYGRSPRVRRGLLSLVVSVFGLLGGLAAAVFSIIDAIDALTQPSGAVFADVPLQPADVAAVIDRWPDSLGVEPADQSFLSVLITGLDDETARSFLVHSVIGYSVTAVVGALLATAAILHLVGRLRWHVLARLVTIGGAVLAVGAVVQGIAYANAIEGASLAVTDGPWLEPGFLVGIDFSAVLVGILFVVLGLALRRVARFAHDADGVV